MIKGYLELFLQCPECDSQIITEIKVRVDRQPGMIQVKASDSIECENCSELLNLAANELINVDIEPQPKEKKNDG